MSLFLIKIVNFYLDLYCVYDINGIFKIETKLNIKSDKNLYLMVSCKYIMIHNLRGLIR